jgi:hypothetical protein
MNRTLDDFSVMEVPSVCKVSHDSLGALARFVEHDEQQIGLPKMAQSSVAIRA